MVNANGWSGLPPGFILNPGESLVSKSGAYRLAMQSDGNLVLYDHTGAPYWASNTEGRPGSRLVMQSDGNLLVVQPNGAPAWDARGDRGGGYALPASGAFLALQDDGNAVVYGADGTALWNAWQSTDNRGSGLSQWIGREEAGVSDIVSKIADVVRFALPVIELALSVTGVGDIIDAAILASQVADLVDAGTAIATAYDVASQAEQLVSQVKQGVNGFNTAIGMLNQAGVTTSQINAIRSSLNDADRAGFDTALENAPRLGGDPDTIAAANSLAASQVAELLGGYGAQVAQHQLAAQGLASSVAASASSGLKSIGVTPTTIASLPVPSPNTSAASLANIVAIDAKAAGLSTAAYVAKTQAAAAAVKKSTTAPVVTPIVSHAPSSPAAASPASSSSSVAPIAIAAGALFLLLGRR